MADPALAVLALVDRKGGAAALVDAVRGQTLPADAAKLAVRAVRSAAREEPALVAALGTAGGATGSARALSSAELAALVNDVMSQGDAARGEAVFRRAEQGCFKCHAIAGAGGRVGPDLVSIGASAQVDYLVESILQPTAKIKENYHSLVVVADGRITSGIRVRETDKELVLRDVEDREVAIPLEAVEEKKEGGSLMPVGLADTLTRSELVDLVRFLSELGKVGPYAVSKAPLARRWQALSPSPEASARLDGPLSDKAPGDEPGLNWASVYSRVSGDLPRESVPTISTKSSGKRRLVRCHCDVATAGQVAIAAAGGVDRIWVDGAAVATDKATPDKAIVDLSPGLHTITLALSTKGNDDVRLELVDVPGSAAQVQIVGGK